MAMIRAAAMALAVAMAGPAVAHADEATGPAFVVMAPGSGAVARVLTTAATCPDARIDGVAVPMAQRAAPATLPFRKNAAKLAADHLAAFPSRVCEVAVPAGARRLSIARQSLPVPPRDVRRIVVLGDTGCRLKAASNAFQACNGPADWPFARIAKAAAALRPDLVLHVGDYEYRENACPTGNSGCAGSPYGYGEDAWTADWLAPADPLLSIAPLIAVRGNHEECRRAGQGWWRLLDPHPLVAGADCIDAANDFAGNHSAPYVVPIGEDARIIVADFSAIGSGDALTDAALTARYRADAQAIEGLARPGGFNIVAAHQPFGAVMKEGEARVGYPAVAQAFSAAPGMPELPHVALMIAGHVHMLQVVLHRARPMQIVNGFSGTQEDAPEVPQDRREINALPGGRSVVSVASKVGQFGFGLLARTKTGTWRYTAYDVSGAPILTAPVRDRP